MRPASDDCAPLLCVRYDRHAAVQYILNSVIPALQANPDRKFIYVEQGFFQRWWRQQTDAMQAAVRQLISGGQLEFINGGWCMHDEGATHYVDMIDQTTLGHRVLKQMFNATPSIGWQIGRRGAARTDLCGAVRCSRCSPAACALVGIADPFGHSLTQASLLSYAAGFDAVFLGRIDYADHALRYNQSRLEFIWRGNPTAGSGAGTRDQVFTQATPTGGYNAPRGLCWDQTCQDPGVQDDPSLTDYNLPERVQAFVDAAVEQGTHSNCQANATALCNIMWMMGSAPLAAHSRSRVQTRRSPLYADRLSGLSLPLFCLSLPCPRSEDFHYENANVWFKNLDKIIRAVNADGRVSTGYSTPSLYVAAKNAEPLTWTVTTTDFFPYASAPHSYWTGYLSSRPALKRMVRTSSAFLQMARQLEFWSGQPAAEAMATGVLEEAVAVSQHHDAVAGTSKQHVAYDYAQRLGRGLDAADAMVNSALAMMVGGADELSFSSCPLLNVSICSTQQSLPRLLLLYNPLARTRRELVRVPLNVSADSRLTVVDSRNATVQSQLVSTFVTSAAVIGAAPSTLSFYAVVPGLGFETFIITQQSSGTAEKEERGPVKAATVAATVASATAVLSNSRWSVAFDAQSGLMASVTDLQSNVTRALSQQFFFYTNGSRGGQQAGAYILLPDSDAPSPVSTAPVNLTIPTGLLVPEARQEVSSWLYQTVRLHDDSIEFEWTVGEVPYADRVGREVITRYSSAIKSVGQWWSDNNGREFSLRQRDYRSSWPYEVTEPVAGNYVPSNLACGLNDSSAAMFVLVDRAQGCSSMVDGQLEFLLHRRLYLDDGKGLNEPLNVSAADGSTAAITAPLRSLSHCEPVRCLSRRLSRSSRGDSRGGWAGVWW